MMKMCFSRAASAAGLVLLAGSAAFGQIDSSWINDTSGSWTDATRWSTPEFPDARGPDIYRAIIDFDAGTAYSIGLDTDIDLDRLRFTSVAATINGGGVGTIVVRTDIELGNATIRALGELMSEGTLRFIGDALCEVEDTPTCQSGGLARKTGTGDIALTGSTVFDLMDGSTFSIENTGDIIGDSSARLNNGGLFIKQSPGTTRIEDVGFLNTGTLVVQQGRLEITNPILPVAGTLGPATYDIGDGAVLDLPGTVLNTNQADVIFRGPDSTFSQFSTVGLNQGLARAEGGANISFSPTGGLTNEGTLIADGMGSSITTGGTLDNNGGTVTVLNGGIVAASGGFGTLNNNGGTVQGTGIVRSTTFNNNGLVSPGTSPGVLISESGGVGTHIFQQGPGGTLLMEIEGRSPGSTFDVLDIRGIGLFDGTLQLEFSPFTGEPQIMPGDQFQIILADSIDGIFQDIQIGGLGSEAIIDVEFTGGGVVVIVRQVPAPGALALLAMGGMLATRRRR